MKTILVCEDDQHMATLLKNELTHEGFNVIIAEDGRSALDQAQSQNINLVLLDVMLPKLNGFEVLRRIRNNSDIPVILETARGDSIDKINGLNFGADDYIAKPFNIEELLARVNAVLRRYEKKTITLKEGKICLNSETMKVTVKDSELELSKTEFFLLKYFMENKEKVLSRNDIIDAVWGKNHYIDVNSVDVYVRFLRSKIAEKDDFEYINTIRGTGYSFKGQSDEV